MTEAWGLSIVIPALNESRYLPQLLRSIAGQDYRGKLQVIVVDGGSKDGTAAQARGFRGDIEDLTVLSAKSDIGHQRNVGAKQAKHPFLLFLDADVVLPARFLEKLMAGVPSRPRFVAAVFHVSERMNLLDWLTILSAYSLFLLAWLGRSPVTNGDCILTTKENHRAVGGFKEGALLGEDTDYGLRSVRSGASYRFFFNPKIVASDRRVREEGRAKLFLFWARSFWHVRKHGPIYPGKGKQYRYGHY